MSTIRDVAKAAGVSTATVSHVLNNTRFVLPETRQAVLAAIEELGYRPNAFARSLNTNITSMIGVIVADVTNPYFASLVHGIEQRLATRGYNTIVCSTGEQPDREANYLDVLLDKRVDALIIAPTGDAQPLYQQFAERQTPLVFIDRLPPVAYGAYVGIDNSAAGCIATEHLLERGHRRIAMMTRRTTISTVAGRIKGYRDALRSYGVPDDDRYLVVSRSNPEHAYVAARQMLTQPEPPTAVVTTNYAMLLGLLRATHELQLVCPRDLSLVAFDDHPWAQVVTPTLTVVLQPIDAMCDAAVNLVLDTLARKNTRAADDSAEADDSEPALIFQAELIVRTSTRAV
jgi:LacI family transcriptional regulator